MRPLRLLSLFALIAVTSRTASAQFGPPYPQPQLEYVQYCTNCNTQVANSVKVGDRCPHCGAVWTFYGSAPGERPRRPRPSNDLFYGMAALSTLITLAYLAKRPSTQRPRRNLAAPRAAGPDPAIEFLKQFEEPPQPPG